MSQSSTAPNKTQQVPQVQQQYRSKQRKREAVQKYEPEQFRDDLFKVLPTENVSDEDICSALESNEQKLDLKRYAEPFFEIFIVGGLVAPGGVVVVKSTFPSAIFMTEPSVSAIKSRVGILNKLARRLKYFPKKLEETVSHLLTYINKFGDNKEKLAIATALFASAGLISLEVLNNIVKDHLVADGSSLNFATSVFQVYLKEQNIDHLTLSLRKAKFESKLLQLFKPNEQNSEVLVSHFKQNDLNPLAEYYTRQQKQAVKDLFSQDLKEHFSGGTSKEEISAFINEAMKGNQWPEYEVVSMIWTSLLTSNDWSSRGDQIEGIAVKLINNWAPLLESFCTGAKSELTLLKHIQAFCYEDSRFLKHFRVLIQNLYRTDVLSESAISYWYEKGASPQGKNVFLGQMEAFVKWLNEQEESSSDEED